MHTPYRVAKQLLLATLAEMLITAWSNLGGQTSRTALNAGEQHTLLLTLQRAV